jgi:glucose/arabinose dehydrogenase
LPENIAPTATASTTGITTSGATTYDFTISYSDNAAVDISSLDSTDIRVTNSNGFNQLATFVSVTPSGNGTPRTATYRINTPGGTWDAADNGSYTVALEASQVRDINGNFAAAGNLGNFSVNIAGTGTGLRGEYYDNIDFTNLKLTRTDATINYDWGTGSPDASIGVDTFSVKWTGQIEAKYNETYTFFSTTDDGVRVKINNQLVIDRFVDQPPTVASGAIALQAGQKYDIEIDYYENGGGAVAKLEWASSTQTRQIVPSTQLYPSKRLPTIALGTVPAYIGEDEGSVQVQVVRSGEDLSETSTVKYSTVGATATTDVDFTRTEGTLTFAPGETSKFVTIPIINDTLLETNETFNFVVDQATGANLGTQRTSTITIIDNENTDLTIVSSRVNENAGSTIVTVIRGNATSAATVNYTSSTETDDTAQPVSDYQSVTGTLSFAVGERSKEISIPIVNNTTGEPNETFTIKFSNPTGGITLNATDRAKITIIDDDPGNITRETVVSGLTEPTSFEWIPNTNNLLIAQKDGIVRVVKNGQLQATPFIDISNEVNNVRDRGLLSITIHPDFQNNPYVYLLYTYDPPEVYSNDPAINNPNSVLDNPDREGNRPSRLLRVRATTDASGNIIFDPNSTASDNRVVLLGTNSNWEFTSNPDGNSTDVKVLPNTDTIDYTSNFAPSGIVKQTGTGELFTNMADYYNNLSNLTNVQDYLATDSESHSIGDMKFGIDGKLYITNGDGTSYNRVDPRGIRVQDVDNLSGKLLRIDPITGEGVADNPFYETSDPNSNRSKVYYSGLRNPFRFTIDDTTGKTYIGDVGWNTWEEINSGDPGSNFGWPYYEGGSADSIQQSGYAGISYTTPSGQVVQPAQTFYASGQPVTKPVYSYQHFGSNAIVMGDFYTGNNLPSIYQNTLFIADISQSTVDSVTLDSQGQFVSTQRFDTGVGSTVQITTGPDGFLYFADLSDGSIKRWRTIV